VLFLVGAAIGGLLLFVLRSKRRRMLDRQGVALGRVIGSRPDHAPRFYRSTGRFR
jgi:hypothetical protein